MGKSNHIIKSIVYTALSIAMVTILTVVIRIPSVRGGYVNFGDIMIFVTAVMLGKRTGFLAGSFGSALADLLSGYPEYAIATFIIKGIEGLLCGTIAGRRENAPVSRLSVAAAFSALWMVAGYFLFEYTIGGYLFANKGFGITMAVADLPGNLVQGAVCAVVAVPFILAIKKTGIKLN
ncbi:MAG TPA: ECF transporter S component [Clostridiaceae bacterium]|nr:ECF transporter S component [Clostridiaceae bacterium]